jgi:hypothetical protein
VHASGEYDVAFSIGQACACSMTLRTANLQFASFPFDWLADGTLPSRTDILIRGFDHWLDKEDFVYDGRNPVNRLGMFHNAKTEINYIHDFADGPIESSYEQVKAKYARREKRLLDLIEKARRVLVVYINATRKGLRFAPSIEDVVRARADLSRAFPNASFDIVHFTLDRGIPFKERSVTTPAEGVTEIRFNYEHEVTDVNLEEAARALLSLGISVRDYRTESERRAYNLKADLKKYRVNTRFGLLLAKTKEQIGGMLRRHRPAR